MVEVRAAIEHTLVQCGCEEGDARRAIAQEWFLPDPLEIAQPLVPLQPLFTSLATQGLAVAVLTADSRAGTRETLSHLKVLDGVRTMVCGDDGYVEVA